MLYAIKKWLFKRTLLKTVQQKIWLNEIDVAMQRDGMHSVEVEKVKRQVEVEKSETRIKELEGAHERVQREERQELQTKVLPKQRIDLGKAEATLSSMEKDIKNKEAENIYLSRRLGWVKKHF